MSFPNAFIGNPYHLSCHPGPRSGIV